MAFSRFALSAQSFENFTATLLQMLIHRVLECKLLLAVRAGEVGGGGVAGDVLAQLLFRLGAMRTVGAVKRSVAVLGYDVSL